MNVNEQPVQSLYGKENANELSYPLIRLGGCSRLIQAIDGCICNITGFIRLQFSFPEVYADDVSGIISDLVTTDTP